MKIAIVGSRNLKVDALEEYLPKEVTEIVSGGARGIDTCAERYARTHGLKLTIFFPDYDQYGKIAPLKRNREIVEYADQVYAFWDGVSRGTSYTIEMAKSCAKPVRVFLKKNDTFVEYYSTFTLL